MIVHTEKTQAQLILEDLAAENERLKKEIERLRHDLERSMSNHNADLNSSPPESGMPVSWIATHENGDVLHFAKADGWQVEAVGHVSPMNGEIK